MRMPVLKGGNLEMSGYGWVKNGEYPKVQMSKKSNLNGKMRINQTGFWMVLGHSVFRHFQTDETRTNLHFRVSTRESECEIPVVTVV